MDDWRPLVLWRENKHHKWRKVKSVIRKFVHVQQKNHCCGGIYHAIRHFTRVRYIINVFVFWRLLIPINKNFESRQTIIDMHGVCRKIIFLKSTRFYEIFLVTGTRRKQCCSCKPLDGPPAKKSFATRKTSRKIDVCANSEEKNQRNVHI